MRISDWSSDVCSSDLLAHNQHDLRELSRRVNAIRLNGIDSEVLTTAEVKAFCPILNCDPGIRYPVLGASLQRRGGVARHDAVAWGYARGADSRGVDIIQNCEVTGIRRDGNRVAGVEKIGSASWRERVCQNV